EAQPQPAPGSTWIIPPDQPGKQQHRQWLEQPAQRVGLERDQGDIQIAEQQGQQVWPAGSEGHVRLRSLLSAPVLHRRARQLQPRPAIQPGRRRQKTQAEKSRTWVRLLQNTTLTPGSSLSAYSWRSSPVGEYARRKRCTWPPAHAAWTSPLPASAGRE